MNKLFLHAFIILFFASCASMQGPFSNIESKDELILQANKGNIKAMLKLNKHYDFPQTKEGLEYFEKWYKLLDKKNNKKDLLKLTEIYDEYSDMFINGKIKTQKLYSLISKTKDKEALLKELDFSLRTYQSFRVKEIEKELINTLNEKQLKDLYEIYRVKYKLKDAKRIALYMETKGFSFPIKYRLELLKKLIYDKNKKDQYHNLINQILDEKNKKDMEELAKFLKRKYKFVQVLNVYKELIELDSKNAFYYLELANIYKRGSYKENLKKDIKKAIKNYKKASLLKNKEATFKLLKNYSSDKKYLKEFVSLKNSLEKSKEGKFILIRYYKDKKLKGQASLMLEDLAQEGNHKAILELALKSFNKYSFNPEEYLLSEQYQKLILETNDKELYNKYKKFIKENYLLRAYKQRAITILEKDNQNILSLRKLYRLHKYKDTKKAKSYLITLANYGDVKSSLSLANTYFYDKKIDKALMLYKKLTKKGEFKASEKLANFYLHPPKGYEKYKDIKKALEIYEQLAEHNNIRALKKLVNDYLCVTCYDGKIINYKKAYKYVKKLHKLNYPAYTTTLAWMYNFGKGVKVDLYKAKTYYEQAAKEGYPKAYFYLAWLYHKDDKDIENEFKIIEVNHKKAFEYLQKGAKKKEIASTNLLGLFYYKGYGVKQDKEKAVEYFKEVAPYNKFASYYLGEYYRDKKEYKKALKAFSFSARRGNSSALIEAGILYEEGQGLKADINKALTLYKKAYNNYDNKIGAFNTALIYHFGKGGIKKDFNLARKWYNLANTKKALKYLRDLENKK